MLKHVFSPILVGREDELSRLEDALLSANRGDGRFVLVTGEAGIGKTRLATELTKRARKLGWSVLWGSCSEAELPLPYLPFVEAIGNHLGAEDTALLRIDLGPMGVELGQLFPQFRDAASSASAGGQGHEKLRLFESIVTLLELWTRRSGLLLVIDDIHWADTSTRELLDYLARRLTRSRVLLVASYRSDELDRSHPLTRVAQVWRRTGLAQTVAVGAITQVESAQMIAAILDADEVSPELARLIHARSEGNPFVLEEMLKEALDREDLYRAETGWRQRPLDALPLPETVREAVLLRLGRLDGAQIETLRAAAILGRTFDYGLLAAVADADEPGVLGALEAAVEQQLLEEDAGGDGRYRWRHALTQEAIAGDTVVPRRQRINSRAADVLIRAGGSAMIIARHLLGAGRTDEAVDACLRAADEAERSVAFTEAVELLERILPHVSEARERALLLSRMGRLRALNGEPAAAEQLLTESVRQLDELGLALEAARARVHLGRCYWELDRPEAALSSFERSRAALEAEGPSADLAHAYLRIAGIHVFQLDSASSRAAAERSIAIAEEAGADYERVWATSMLAVSYIGTALEFAILDRAYREAEAKNYAVIAGSILHNEIWARVHTLAGGLGATLEKLATAPFNLSTSGAPVAKSWAELGLGAPRNALEQARAAATRYEGLGNSKFLWRARLAEARALLELGRASAAEDALPPPSPGNELQDIVYDTPARIGIALALGRVDEAVALARRASGANALLVFRETVVLAVEAFVAGGFLAEAQAVVERAEGVEASSGQAGLEIARGRILLAKDLPGEAFSLFEQALERLERAELWLWVWQTRALAAEAAARSGSIPAARELFTACIRDTENAGAMRIRDAARAAAERLGLGLPTEPAGPSEDGRDPDVLQPSERLVTSMFADVRGYTRLVAGNSPAELADRLTTLHRWAAAEVRRRNGIVDKFAGDAVMATFNVAGARLDHATLALEAAFALRDKAALLDLPVGVGIAVGPAVVTRSVAEANVSVLGLPTNLAARLQEAAAAGEILLSDEAFRRSASWLHERGLETAPEALELAGFDAPQTAYRLRAPDAVDSRPRHDPGGAGLA